MLYLKLIRWEKLLFIVYTFLIIRFQLFEYYNIKTNLTNLQLIQLLASVVLITAAGFIINSIFTIHSSKNTKVFKVLNKKNISIEKVKQWYLFTNSIGLILGIQICLAISKPSFSVLFIGTSLLFYFYSKKIKKIALVGELLISLLLSLGIGLYILLDINFSNNNISNIRVLYILSLMVFFTFIINFILEAINRIISINADYKFRIKSLPIIFGRSRIKLLASYLCLIPIFIALKTVWSYSDSNAIFSIFLFIFVCSPLTYIAVKLRSINSNKEYRNLKIVLKTILFLSISSLLFFLKL